MNNIQVNKSRYRLILYLAFCLSLLLAIAIQSGGYSKDTGSKIFFSLIIITIASSILRELLIMKPVMILDSHGIYFRDQGYYNWDMFEGFSLLAYHDNPNEELTFHFPGGGQVMILINDLEKNPEEIIGLVLKVSGRDRSFFFGNRKQG